MKGSRSEPDAGEDRDKGVDEGGEDAKGPCAQTNAWRRSGDEPKIVF